MLHGEVIQRPLFFFVNMLPISIVFQPISIQHRISHKHNVKMLLITIPLSKKEIIKYSTPPSLRPRIFSISCIVSQNLAKSYVGGNRKPETKDLYPVTLTFSDVWPVRTRTLGSKSDEGVNNGVSAHVLEVNDFRSRWAIINSQTQGHADLYLISRSHSIIALLVNFKSSLLSSQGWKEWRA